MINTLTFTVEEECKPGSIVRAYILPIRGLLLVVVVVVVTTMGMRKVRQKKKKKRKRKRTLERDGIFVN
jgi:hypothetical protein